MTRIREQLRLEENYAIAAKPAFHDAGAAENKALPLHRWVPWIAGFSASFVRDVIREYMPTESRGDSLILDPFAGVGTTLVEGLREGFNVVGFEINAYAALAANAKIRSLDINPVVLEDQMTGLLEELRASEASIDSAWCEAGDEGVQEMLLEARLGRSTTYRSRIPFFSAPVEAKVLAALEGIKKLPPGAQPIAKVALGATMISVSNYSYEPSLSSRPGAGKPLIGNASLAEPLAQKLSEMVEDVEWARQAFPPSAWKRRGDVVLGSYFDAGLPPESVSLVVTSPPYMNNYHYVRNTRPQLFWLDLVSAPAQMKQYETENFGKYWQTVRQGPVVELEPDLPELRNEIDRLRGIRTEKGTYGGSGWANYVASYFNDSWRFVSVLKEQLAQGGTAVIVVGNSLIQGIEFKVDALLADLGELAGLTCEAIAVVRTKRVGNSIIGSSVRNDDGESKGSILYDAAVILRKEH